MSDKPKEQYLPEDQDLINELSNIGETSTGTAWNHQVRRLNELQIKSVLRSRKTADEVDKSNTRFSIILVAFTMIQIVIALCSLLYDIETTGHGWTAFWVMLLLFIAIVVILKTFDPDKFFKK